MGLFVLHDEIFIVDVDFFVRIHADQRRDSDIGLIIKKRRNHREYKYKKKEEGTKIKPT